jgi:hypothetical protein
VCITAINKWGSKEVCTSIIIGDTCNGIKIDDGRTTTKPNQMKTFKITFANVGTKSCLAVDFGHGGPWALYGEKANCESTDVLKKMNIPTGVNAKLAGALPATGVTASATYLSAGMKTIKVTGANYLAANTESLTFSVSKNNDCQRPDITIYETRPIENGFHCPISEKCKLRGKVISLKCKPETNRKYWEMKEVDDNGNVKRTIDVTMVAGYNSVYMVLPARFTGLGVYRLTLYIQMTGSDVIKKQNFISSATTYIYITKGPIYVAMMKGGLSAMTIGKFDEFELNPSKYSLDKGADKTVSIGPLLFQLTS